MITQMLLAGGGSALARAYIAAMTVQPSSQRRKLIIDTLAMLERAGIPKKCDALYIGAAHDQQAARINVMNPTGALLTSVGTGQFTVDSGLYGSGSGNYWTTPFNMNSLTHLKQNDNHVAYWCNSNVTGINEDLGQQGNNEFNMAARDGASGRGFTGLTGANGYRYTALVDTPTAIGMRAFDRSSSSDFDLYQDGVLMTTTGVGTLTSVPLLANPLRIGRSNRYNASGRHISFLTIGASLTATEHLALKNAVEYYMSNL